MLGLGRGLRLLGLLLGISFGCTITSFGFLGVTFFSVFGFDAGGGGGGGGGGGAMVAFSVTSTSFSSTGGGRVER